MAGVLGRSVVCLTKDLDQVPSVWFHSSILPSWVAESMRDPHGRKAILELGDPDGGGHTTKVVGVLYLLVARCLLCRHVKINQRFDTPQYQYSAGVLRK